MMPKIIHYCWVDGSPIPEKNRRCIESWKKFCPDFEIIEWNESNYNFSGCAYMRQAYESGLWGFVPNYARMDIIYREGGIYLDTDVEVIRSLDSLLDRSAFMGFENRASVAPGLGFGAEPGNSVIREMRDLYENLSFFRDDHTPSLIPSPVYATKILKAHGLRTDGRRQTVADIDIFPPEYFAPLRYADNRLRVTKNTYSIHWYHASWHTPEQRKLAGRMRKINRIFGLRLGRLINRGLSGISKIRNYIFK